MEDKIKIVFFGTPTFSIKSLEALINNDKFEVQAIVTQEDKPVGRKQILTPSKIKGFYLANQNICKNIEMLTPEKLNKDEKIISKLKNYKSDFFVIVSFGQILSKQILEIPKHGCINLHVSMLPKYRGASPIQQSLLNGDSETGVTIMRMDEGMDTGDILSQKEIKIQNEDDIITLSNKISIIGAELLIETLIKKIQNEIEAKPQNHINATYCSKINKEDGKINFEEDDSKKIINKLRAFTIWPSCYTYFNNKKIKITEAAINDIKNDKQAGQVFLDESGNLNLATNDNKSIILKKVHLEGKNETDIKDFLRGYPDFQKATLK